MKRKAHEDPREGSSTWPDKWTEIQQALPNKRVKAKAGKSIIALSKQETEKEGPVVDSDLVKQGLATPINAEFGTLSFVSARCELARFDSASAYSTSSGLAGPRHRENVTQEVARDDVARQEPNDQEAPHHCHVRGTCNRPMPTLQEITEPISKAKGTTVREAAVPSLVGDQPIIQRLARHATAKEGLEGLANEASRLTSRQERQKPHMHSKKQSEKRVGQESSQVEEEHKDSAVTNNQPDLKRELASSETNYLAVPVKKRKVTQNSNATEETQHLGEDGPLKQVRSTPPQADASFKYTPLNRNKQSIRLVRVLPRKCVTDRLRCEIRNTTVDAKYTCISYEWGPPELRSWGRILVNGRTLRVGLNLMNFLVHAATRNTNEWYWIDALCINQLSVAERNHQVQHMGLIYSKACSVLAWLGTDTKIAQFLADPQTTGSRFYAFWSSSYWDRAWITQELALARRVVLVAKSTELDIRSLPFYNQAEHNDDVDLSRLSALNPAKTHSLRSKNIIQLLHKFRFKECERSQDRVYSLLALCGTGSNLHVDYGIPREDLAGQILKSCYQTLCLCSVRTVSKVLRIDDSPCSMNSTLPFAEFDVPNTSGDQRHNPVAHFTVDLSLVCRAYHGTLEIDVDPDTAGLTFGYRERWGRFMRTNRGGSTCTVKTSSSGQITICLSLIALLDIARLARLALLSDGVCKGAGTGTGSLRLHKLPGQGHTTDHPHDSEAEPHVPSSAGASLTRVVLPPILEALETCRLPSPAVLEPPAEYECGGRDGGGGGGRGNGYN